MWQRTPSTAHAAALVCADCGAAYGSGVSLVWQAGAWYCADEGECAERTAHRYGGDALAERTERDELDELAAHLRDAGLLREERGR